MVLAKHFTSDAAMWCRNGIYVRTPMMLKTPGFLGKADPARDSLYPTLNKPATAPAPQPATITSATTPIKAVEAVTQNNHDKSFSNDGTIGNRLIVGPDVKLKGAEINDCDTLIVEGRVEATLDSRIIRIAEQGAFNGTVGVDTAEIHGRFDGELTARGQLFIHATGHVSGKIRYGKILIEEGGQISGDVQAIAANDASMFNTNKPKPLVSMS
jgi:cytoskeletal protein CcmA (bactofilin family)